MFFKESLKQLTFTNIFHLKYTPIISKTISDLKEWAKFIKNESYNNGDIEKGAVIGAAIDLSNRKIWFGKSHKLRNKKGILLKNPKPKVLDGIKWAAGISDRAANQIVRQAENKEKRRYIECCAEAEIIHDMHEGCPTVNFELLLFIALRVSNEIVAKPCIRCEHWLSKTNIAYAISSDDEKITIQSQLGLEYEQVSDFAPLFVELPEREWKGHYSI